MTLWNYLDTLPLLCLIYISGSRFYDHFTGHVDDVNETNKVRDQIQAVVATLVWLKSIYFLRCFDSTGWLVRMMGEVLNDMKVFLFVFTITIISFSDFFYSISKSQAKYAENGAGGFIDSYLDAIIYTYLLTLGEFDTDSYIYGIAWVFFILCSLFNLIIMLNLLIAIISATFTAVTTVSELATFQEHTRIMVDYDYLDRDAVRDVERKKDNLLLVVMEKVQETRVDDKKKTEKILKDVSELKTVIKSNFTKLKIQVHHV